MNSFPAWPLTPVGGKPGSLSYRNLSVHPQFTQNVMKAAAQNQRQRGPEPGQFLEPRRCGSGIGLSLAHCCSIVRLKWFGRS